MIMQRFEVKPQPDKLDNLTDQLQSSNMSHKTLYQPPGTGAFQAQNAFKLANLGGTNEQKTMKNQKPEAQLNFKDVPGDAADHIEELFFKLTLLAQILNLNALQI